MCRNKLWAHLSFADAGISRNEPPDVRGSLGLLYSACACRFEVTVTSVSLPPFMSRRGLFPYKPTSLSPPSNGNVTSTHRWTSSEFHQPPSKWNSSGETVRIDQDFGYAFVGPEEQADLYVLASVWRPHSCWALGSVLYLGVCACSILSQPLLALTYHNTFSLYHRPARMSAEDTFVHTALLPLSS